MALSTLFIGAKVDRLDTEGNSCLLMAMHYGCKEDIVKLLLRRTKSSFLTHVNKVCVCVGRGGGVSAVLQVVNSVVHVVLQN